MSRPTRLDLAQSASWHTHFPISSQRFWLDYGICKRTMVHCCLASSWVSAFRCRPDQVDQHHCKAMPGQCRSYKVKLWWVHQGLPWGCCQFPIYRQPADPYGSSGGEYQHIGLEVFRQKWICWWTSNCVKITFNQMMMATLLLRIHTLNSHGMQHGSRRCRMANELSNYLSPQSSLLPSLTKARHL
jgi:hypothetical protein